MTYSTMDVLMILVLGMAIGGIAPVIFLVKTLCRSLLIHIKGYDEIEERLAAVEEKVRAMIDENDLEWTEDDCDGIWYRDDLPYDAMGDYSRFKWIRPVPGEPRSTGMESPDDWYHEEFGEEDEDDYQEKM